MEQVAEKKSGDLRVIPISQIRENPVALRAVDREDPAYQGLVASIREKGFIGAITVREQRDAETNEMFYELVDGLHRYTASKDAGLVDINVNVIDASKAQVLEVQLMANIHKIETKPIEYTRQLKRILAANPSWVEAELARKLGKTTQWIKDRLSLNKISNPKAIELIDSGKISLANAYALAKLPAEELSDFIDRAMTLPPAEFIPVCNTRIKEVNEAKRQGRDAEKIEFQPVAFMRKLKDIKEELSQPKIAKILCKGLKSAEDGFAMGVKWVLNQDPESVKKQVVDNEERIKAREEARKKREAEKSEKGLEKAKKEAAEAAAKVEEVEKK